MDKVDGMEKKSGVIEILLAVGYGVKYASYMAMLSIEGFGVGDHFSGFRIESKAYFIRAIQTNSVNPINYILPGSSEWKLSRKRQERKRSKPASGIKWF